MMSRSTSTSQANGQLDKPYHEVTWERLVHPDLHIGALRSFEQKPLARRGDDVRIDWGTLLLGVPPPTRRWPSGAPMPYDSSSLTMAACLRRTGKRPRTPRIAGGGPVIAVSLSFQGVGPEIQIRASAHRI